MHLSGDLPDRPVSVERAPQLTGWDLVDPDRPPAEPAVADVAARPAPEAEGAHRPAPGVTEPTPEQDQAIRRRSEPLHLAAGAGSGKTAVLVERFVGAVHEDGISPDRILAITFTERAAGELRARVSARLSALGEAGAAAATSGAFVGTFHGFCARLLRAHAREAGVGAEFAILDESQASRLRRQAFAATLGEFVGAGSGQAGGDVPGEVVAPGSGFAGAGPYQDAGDGLGEVMAPAPGEGVVGGSGEAVDLIAAYTADRARATVLGLYAELRSQGQRTPRLSDPRLDEEPAAGRPRLSSEDERRAQRLLDERGARSLTLWARLLEGFGERYEGAKRGRDGLDFDDLELIAGELLLGDERLQDMWAERFDLLMVDELQDVNPRQLALVAALERGNLFTVGDEWQSIYRFRHADVGLFRARHEQLAPRGRSLRLTRNFRGRPELLGAVNAVFGKRFADHFTPLRPGRESPREREAKSEPRVELLLSDRRGWSLAGAPGWRAAEAEALASRVASLVRAGSARLGDVAVLLRGTADIDCYEQALRAEGLETVASAGTFWERQEVADLLAYLRALADPADEIAVYGALAAAPVGLSTDDLALLARAARERGESLWETARAGAPIVDSAGPAGGGGVAGGGGERMESYCAWLDLQREQTAQTPLAELLERAIAHFELPVRLTVEKDGARRLANVRKLVDLAADWERSEGRDLGGFLAEAAFQQGQGGRLASAETIAEPDAPPSVTATFAPETGTSGSAAPEPGPQLATPASAVEPEAVALMSVHAAKGLEFDVVCVADLGRAPSMGVPDLLVDGERVGVRLLGLDDPEPRPALQYAELSAERREAQAEEEDRILYVAMTRARERLVLSGAVDFAAWPRDRPGAAPIAWLGPALAGELPALCAEAVRAPAEEPRELVLGLVVDGTDVSLRCQLSIS
jgi:ATP-dependent helicase/nuclease subunit A